MQNLPAKYVISFFSCPSPFSAIFVRKSLVFVEILQEASKSLLLISFSKAALTLVEGLVPTKVER